METIEIKELIYPRLLHSLPEAAYEQVQAYVHLLMRWNSRINLTAVRDARVLVGLHIGECLRAAQRIPREVRSVLDFGSGAGLPGIPIQIVRPELAVTLAESQSKKAAFLREAIRELRFPRASVFAGRVQDLPSERQFDGVALRAVDRMELALQAAATRVRPGGFCLVLTSEEEQNRVAVNLPGFRWESDAVPGTRQRAILLGRR